MAERTYGRKEFESEDEKWRQAAQALTKRAQVQSERGGGIVDPETVGLREEDYPGGRIDPALKAAIDKERGTVSTAASSVAEEVEVDPRLTTFKVDYTTSKNPKLTAFPWEEIRTRLLADEGALLNAALELNERGILFGVDAVGNPLMCDRGDQAVMTDMNYEDTRARVRYRHNSNDKQGQMLKDDKDQPVPTGYEMFPQVDRREKSDEIKQYEAHTGRVFVLPPAGEKYQSSWTESGDNPGSSPENQPWPRIVEFEGRLRLAPVRNGYPEQHYPYRGVRRLLRVIKKA